MEFCDDFIHEFSPILQTTQKSEFYNLILSQFLIVHLQ